MNHLPKTSQQFLSFMTHIWGAASWQDYDRYHDAITTARLCGMVRTGGGHTTETYRFPTAIDGVTIQRNGIACWPANRFASRS